LEFALSFMHIGKTGGTTLKAVLTQHNNRSPDLAVELHPHSVTLPWLETNRPEHRCIFFVRDPIDRFVSGFNSRLRCGRPRYNFPWSQGEAITFSYFRTANDLAEGLDSPERSRRCAARVGMREIAHVRQGLADFLVSAEYLEDCKQAGSFFFIGTQETFRHDLESLRALLGIDVDVEMPVDAVGQHRTPSNLTRSLSNRARRNLERWYAADYPILQWCLRFHEQSQTTRAPSPARRHG
jgi:hypothetical protein